LEAVAAHATMPPSAYGTIELRDRIEICFRMNLPQVLRLAMNLERVLRLLILVP
jgi:hypothetical protein